MSTCDRRTFMGLGAAAVLGAPTASGMRAKPSGPQGRAAVPTGFPLQDPALVADLVRFAHFDLAKVQSLVGRHPAVAKAAVDWGFGDWEDALGAASHTGRADIAELLLANGARPTIFSAAMLGQLNVVRAFIDASPGCQSTYGPHSITLLSHASAGGERARAVREYLEQLGDADPRPPGATTLDESRRAKYAGSYVYGPGADATLIVANEKTGLTVTRAGLPFARPLVPVGEDVFTPLGAEAVRIRFNFLVGAKVQLSVSDPEPSLTATRS